MKGSKFDFTVLFKFQQDMKNGFRNLKLSEQRFKKALSRSHNRFFQKILAEKKAQYQIDLQDVDNVRSRKYQKSDSVIVQGTGDKGQLIFQDDLRPSLPVPSTSKSTKKPQFQNRGKRPNLRSSVAQSSFVNRVRKSINSSQQSSMQPKTMTPEANRQSKISQPVSFAYDNQSPYVSPQNTRSFVRDDSQSPIKKRQYTMMTRKTLQMQKGNYQPEKYFQLKPDDDQSFQQYFELMQDPITRRMYAKMILDAHQRADIQITELATMLSQATLRLFCNLRDKLITLEQFKARIVEREMNLKYTCIDDLGEYLKKTSQSHKNSTTGLGIRQFRTTKGDQNTQNSARQTTSSSKLMTQDQRTSIVDPKWKRQYQGVADRSEIMYKKKFSDVTIGQILQPRQPWKTNKRCLRSIISLSRPRTALPAKKRNNIVFDQKKMQQQQQKQKRDNNNDSNLGKKKKYKSILDDQILGTTKVSQEQQAAAKKRLQQQSSGDFNSRSRLNLLQAAIANTSQSIQESFKSGEQNNLKKEQTEIISSQSNKKLKKNLSECHDIYQDRTIFLSNRGSQRHSNNSSQIPDPFKYTKASSTHYSSKKKRRALSKPQSTVLSSNIKKKDSLAFLNRFEELNQIVIRQPEHNDQSVHQDRDRQQTKEILRKATSGVGYRPNLSQPQIEDQASSSFYLKNNENKYMSQTSISSQYRGGPVPGWPQSPHSTQSKFKHQDSQLMQQQLIDQQQTSSKVVMDVNSMGGVSNSFKSFIRRLGVPVLRNIKTVIGSDGNRRIKDGQPPEKSFSQLSSPYASVPFIHNQQYQSAANYKRIINNQSNLSFQSTAFSNSGDYKTKAIYHRLGLNKASSQLNYTFF